MIGSKNRIYQHAGGAASYVSRINDVVSQINSEFSQIKYPVSQIKWFISQIKMIAKKTGL